MTTTQENGIVTTNIKLIKIVKKREWKLYLGDMLYEQGL